MFDFSPPTPATKTAEPQVVTDLRAARAYVERGWTTLTDARDASGFSTAPDAPDATQWCLVGALIAGLGHYDMLRTQRGLDAVAALNAAVGRPGGGLENRCYIDFNNDQASSAPVLALIDRAIAMATAREVAHV